MTRSPKQPQAERHRDWYPYYAGFTEAFVEELLAEDAPNARSILDPWNGSGTTTAACAKLGLSGSGVDINPVLTIIARARLTPRSVAESLGPLALKIVIEAGRHSGKVVGPDLLNTWLQPGASSEIRRIQQSIHSVLSDLDGNALLSSEILAARLPLLACFYYAALFAATRDTLRRFRSANPTWVGRPPTWRHRLAPSRAETQRLFIDRVAFLAQRLGVTTDEAPKPMPDIITGSAVRLPFERGTFDAAITSPPYATRIDYVMSVLPELAVLGALKVEIEALRQLTTGTPVVRGFAPAERELSRSARQLVADIASHTSKGSRSYYYPWMSKYLLALQGGLLETARVVKPGGTIAVVVQDSHYKEIHVRLQEIVIEILAAAGRTLKVRRDYKIRHHRVQMNMRARRHLSKRQNVESVLVFR